MHFLSTKRRCESIFEVIIAITVISIGTSAITLLITTVMHANNLSKQFIIANNLATEGLDAVSNVRESNWIEFPGYETDCWNVIASVDDPTNCTTASNKIGGTYGSTTPAIKYFVPALDTINTDGTPITYRWTLTQKKAADILTSDLSNPTDDVYRLDVDTSTGLYITATTGIFYRMITIEYYDDGGSIDTTDDSHPAKAKEGEYMNITSTVEWEDKLSKVHTVTKTTRLFNHVSS